MREKIASMCFFFEEKTDTKCMNLTDNKLQAKQNFLPLIDFFWQKMRTWGLFHFNEDANVFFMTFPDFAVSKCHTSSCSKNQTSSSPSQPTGVTSLGKKMLANQNIQVIFITCERIVQPIKTLMRQM